MCWHYPFLCATENKVMAVFFIFSIILINRSYFQLSALKPGKSVFGSASLFVLYLCYGGHINFIYWHCPFSRGTKNEAMAAILILSILINLFLCSGKCLDTWYIYVFRVCESALSVFMSDLKRSCGGHAHIDIDMRYYNKYIRFCGLRVPGLA